MPGKSAESRLIRLVAGARSRIHAAGGRASHRRRDRPAAGLDRSGRGVDRSALRPTGRSRRSSDPPRPRCAIAPGRRNPIDNFILARLDARRHCALARSVEVDPAPPRQSSTSPAFRPRPKRSATFLSDNRPDAYERLVDRLLDSPHYGEKWARYWLDLARYADSDGYEKDRSRPWAWRYRQWVIDALNRDLPFDQFTDPAARRRPAAESQSRHAGRHRLQSQHAHQSRRRHRSRTVPRRAGARSRRHARHRLAGPDGGLRAVPQPQVRPDQRRRSSTSSPRSSIPRRK